MKKFDEYNGKEVHSILLENDKIELELIDFDADFILRNIAVARELPAVSDGKRLFHILAVIGRIELRPDFPILRKLNHTRFDSRVIPEFGMKIIGLPLFGNLKPERFSGHRKAAETDWECPTSDYCRCAEVQQQFSLLCQVLGHT